MDSTPGAFLGLMAFAFVVSAAAVVSPGPVTAAIVSEAPRRGWRAGALIAGGHVALELIMVFLLGWGLAEAMSSESLKRGLGLAGGIVLLLLGGSYVLGAWNRTIRLPSGGSEAPRRSLGLPVAGALATISNPYWYAWWVTVAAGYLAQAHLVGAAGLAAFYLGHITADITWDTGLAAAIGAGARWITPPRYQLLIYVTGGFMLYLGTQYLRLALLPG